MTTKTDEYTIVLGVIGADCHAVGNKILENALTTKGINVENQGVMVSQDEFAQAALDCNADAILVSSIYGHGEIDCQGFREKCEEYGIGDIVLYVGGNLVIGKKDFQDVEKQFQEMGFDRVFRPTADIAHVADLLKDDINLHRSRIGHNYSAVFQKTDTSSEISKN
ncbi:methylaspartate mutase subunit S [Terasakiella sp. A23]|uniref:methylaspartate mutase subunit S n=1 Tax=Terasakiella sp. FCG-A23 TaxID=3080561 RepID=UPI0029537E55|nr:methylaspartate mutase subunit S [Terasakiella sp. A23]MDV7339482.1 methylaspartate mutase subunit S [Terasakiella sp. A23]